MSQEFSDPEIFADFIIESKEHLETIEPNLLELEKAPDNLGLLNEIFRPMHSLKGASGFLGLNRINGLAHRAENILDELRKGTMGITPEIMDVILASTDALRQMIENLERTGGEGDVDTAPLIATIDAIMAGEQPAPLNVGKTLAAETAAPADVPADVPNSGPGSGPDSAPAAPASAPVPEIQPLRAQIDTSEWIHTLPPLPTYALTAFGEAHLRDFIEEARENTANISDGLLTLEKNPEAAHGDLVNDIFRYFHNLKGNSGIIGYHELNGLTHEAETLLNLVRHNEMQVSRPLVDILLLVVDMLEALIGRIDSATGNATPFSCEELLVKLRQAISGGAIELPDSLVSRQKEAAPAEEAAPAAPVSDEEDIDIFKDTVRQQMANISIALEGMAQDGFNQEFPNAVFRSLGTLQNSSGYMGLDDIKNYAQLTAGIVDQGRKAGGMDFSLMVDLLRQECSIIGDMLQAALVRLEEAAKAPAPAPASAPAPAPAGKPVVPAAPAAPAAQKPEAPKEAAPKAQAPKTDAAKTDAPKADAARPAPASAAPAASAPKAEAPKPASGQAPSAPGAGGAGKPAPAKNEEAPKSSSTIRVDHEKLDHLMNLIGELIINRNRYSMLARHLEENTNVDVTKVAQDLSETTYAMARISDDLQDTIMKVRMVPVSSVFSRFPRLVRDLSRKSGKEVDLILEGEETELDKSVVEVIGDPLVHLIRNSVDHGIEEEAVRRERGKDPKGRVCLRAYHKGNSVAIEVEDDGKGIDPEKMREVAVRKGVISQDEARALDDREAMELIFAPGFSSAETITDISGRGVGMDVVRTNIKSLKGSINITSEVGKGTKFTLSLPLTLAIIDALMVNVDEEMFAIPLDAVSETTKIEAVRLTDVKGRKAVTLRGEVLGIISLAELFGLPCHMAEQDVLSVVVIHDNDRRLGLVVDRLLERQEIVIKPLGSYLGDLKGISGATIMGDGSVILILDPHEIYMLATSKAL